MDTLIRNILRRKLNDTAIDKLFDKYFDAFEAAFTSKEYDKQNNYEYFEQLGDLSINKFIVNYMSKRFPQLRNSDGVPVLATLRILYGSKDILSKLSEKYQLDKFIRCTPNELIDVLKYKDILEDVFEALFGAIEYSVDNLWYDGLGYITVYRILESMYNEMDIKIDYESLVDAKTRLNELKDIFKINVKYIDKRLQDNSFESTININYQNIDYQNIGIANSNIKKTAQILAAEKALIWIKENLRIEKTIPERFQTFSNKKTW